jgi:hypothetical protein
MGSRYAVYSVMYHGFNWEAIEVLTGMLAFAAICVAIFVIAGRRRR